MGADYLEQDLVVSADNELIVLHDVHLDRTTDVAERYPERVRDDGRYYARDFTLTELRDLRVRERTNADGNAVYTDRFPFGAGCFRLHTLAEELQLAAHLQTSIGRSVGVYPEIKAPAMHRGAGVDISSIVLRELANFGFSDRAHGCYLQCFDAAELQRIRHELHCDLRLVQLIGENDWGESATDYNALRSPQGLKQLSHTVDAIGPWIQQLYDIDPVTGDITATDLVSDAHDAGLAVHPYTLRCDDLPPGFHDFGTLCDFLFDDLRVDGVFTDFPDRVAARFSV